MKMYTLLIHGAEQQEAAEKAKAEFDDIELAVVENSQSGQSFLAAELVKVNHPFVYWLREYSFAEWFIVAVESEKPPVVWDDSRAIFNQ